MPKNFSAVKDSVQTSRSIFTPAAYFSMFYTIINNDESVAVGFYTFATGPNYSIPRYTYNEGNFKRIINDLADSMAFRKETLDTNVFSFYRGEALKKCNADVACTYTVQMSRPYMDKYYLCKGFCMYKKDHGEVYAFYFYNKGTPIDKYLKENAFMLTFDN